MHLQFGISLQFIKCGIDGFSNFMERSRQHVVLHMATLTQNHIHRILAKVQKILHE